MKSAKSGNKYRSYLLSVLGISLFLFLFFPANRTEVDDAFWYAASIRDDNYIALFNPRFFLFLPLFKSLYDLLLLFGVSMDAYSFLCTVSTLFSILTLLLLYNTLRQYLKFERWSALFVVCLLAVSCEFWRYSVEAEVYIVAMFFVLLTLRLFLQWDRLRSPGTFVGLCLIASFTTLLYKPSFIPVYLIFGLLFLYRKKYWQFILYNAFGAVIIVGSFYLVYRQMNTEISFPEYLFGGANEPVGSAAGAIFVIASNMLSVLWIFGWNGAIAFITDRFPHKVVEEEMFLASQVGNLKFLLMAVFLGLAVIFLYLVINAIRRRRQFSKKRFKVLVLILLWMVVYSAFLLVMDPTSNEPWLMVQIPLVIFFAVLLVEPLKKSQRWIAFTFLVLVFINNTVGGMSLLTDQHYDYYYRKAQWLKTNATAGDYIITYGPMSFVRYLRYHTPSKVINFEEDQGRAFEVLRKANEISGEIYFPENVFRPPQAILYRAQIDVKQTTAFFRQHQYSMQQVSGAGGEEFKTYKLVNE